MKIQRCNYIPEGEIKIIEDMDTLIHNLVTPELKELQQENKQLKEQLDVHKILLQTNAPSTCILTELEEFLNHKLEQTGSYNKNDDEDRIEYLMHRYYAFREIGKYIEKLKEKYNGQ